MTSFDRIPSMFRAPMMGLLFSLGALAQGCQGPVDDAAIDDLEVQLSDEGGKQDAIFGKKFRCHVSAYAPLNEALDEWATGSYSTKRDAAGVYDVTGPMYKVRPDMSSGLWWSVDIRIPVGETTHAGFVPFWREVGTSAWQRVRPTTVSRDDGTSYSASYYSNFKLDNGTLTVGAFGTSGLGIESDFFFDDIRPEFGFFPIPVGSTGTLTGSGSFEISITEQE